MDPVTRSTVRVPTRRPLRRLAGHLYFAELRTDDVDTACAFYGEMFGWDYVEVERPDLRFSVCRIAQIAGRDTAAITSIDDVPDLRGTRWVPYLNVDDLDAAIARTTLHGGGVIDGPLLIPGEAYIATIVDPTGAEVALSQDVSGRDTPTVKDDHGAPFWFEQRAADDARPFYTALTQWTYDPCEDCSEGERGARQLALPVALDDAQPVAASFCFDAAATHPRWITCFAVTEKHAAFERALGLGATPCETTSLDDPTRQAARLLDPLGAEFCIIEPMSPA